MKAIILTAIAVSLLICALVFPMEKQQSASASKYIHTPGDLDMKYIHQLGYKVGYNDGVTESECAFCLSVSYWAPNTHLSSSHALTGSDNLWYLVLHFWVGSFCDVINNDRRFVFPREVIA